MQKNFLKSAGAVRWIPRFLSWMVSKVIDLILSFFSEVRLVFKRLGFNLGLTISSVIGIVAVLAMVVCVPIFAHAVSSEVLRQQLEEKAITTHRSLVSMHMYYLDKLDASPMDLGKVQTISRFMTDSISSQMGLSVSQMVVEVQSTQVSMMPLAGNPKLDPNDPYVVLSFMSNEIVPEHGEIVEGQWPSSNQDPSGLIQVAILEETADESYLNIGDRFMVGEK